MDVHASIEVYQPANGHCLEIVWKPRRSYCANNPPPRPAPPNDNNASKIVRTHLHDAKSHHTFSAPQIGVLGLFCLCTRPLCLYTRSLLPLYCASGPLPPPSSSACVHVSGTHNQVGMASPRAALSSRFRTWCCFVCVERTHSTY